MDRCRVIVIASALLALGCRDKGPPSYVGERVSVTTDVVEQVCRGTLEHLDAELARIEAELELVGHGELVEIHVVDDAQIGEHCGPDLRLCTVSPPRRIYMTPDVVDKVITRELVRDRVARTPAGGTKPLLFEGVGVALSRPICEPGPEWIPPTATRVLEATTNSQLGGNGRYLGGELMRWLLDTHGPAEVLDFMATIRAGDDAHEVRLAYLERFATQIDVDLYAYWHPYDQPIAPARAGCVGPEAQRDEPGLRARIEATLDCDSPRVRNDFGDPSKVFVEWTLTIDDDLYDEIHSFNHAIVGELSEGVEVMLTHCECELTTHTTRIYSPNIPKTLIPGKPVRLEPGVYRLRARGPIGGTVDLSIELPCDHAQPNCPATQQCTRWGKCIDEVPNPAGPGEPCGVPLDDQAPRTCTPDATCMGPVGGQGSCMGNCSSATDCSTDAICSPWGVCASSCDPLTQDCQSGWGCVPMYVDVCLPVGDAGPLEPCRIASLDCAPGLICSHHQDVDGCDALYEDGLWIGCCAPFCDLAAVEPGCPAQLPNCQGYDGGPVGLCRP